MKHASDSAFNRIEVLLQSIRQFGELHERTRGVFYLKGQAYLHFHEDPAGIFADLKLNCQFERFAVNTEAEKNDLLTKIKDTLAPSKIGTT